MKSKQTVDRADGLFDGLTPPGPEPQLRTRVLAAARRGAGTEPVRDVWTRIWENKLLRVAWAASIIALLVGHGVLVPAKPDASSVVMAEADVDEELAEFLRLVRIKGSAAPNLGRGGASRHPLAELENGDSAL